MIIIKMIIIKMIIIKMIIKMRHVSAPCQARLGVSRSQKAPPANPTISLSVCHETRWEDYQTNWSNQLVIFTHFWSLDISLNQTRNGKNQQPAFPDPTCERCMNTILVEERIQGRSCHTHTVQTCIPVYLNIPHIWRKIMSIGEISDWTLFPDWGWKLWILTETKFLEFPCFDACNKNL